MADLVHIGSPKGQLLVPQTTLPDLLCHTITDGELALLTNTTATFMGALCTTALGIGTTSIVGAWPAIDALSDGIPSKADASSFVYLIVTAMAVAVFLLTGFLSIQHQRSKGSKADQIRKRPKVPMRLSDAEQS